MPVTATTEGVREHERFDFWHEVICNAYVHLQAETLPSEQWFAAEMHAATLGPVTLSRVLAEPHSVDRTPELIDSKPDETIMASLMVHGSGILAQDGRDAALGAGDLALYDSSRPFSLVLPDRFDTLVLQFDREALLRRWPAMERLMARTVPAGTIATTPLAALLRSFPLVNVAEDSAVARQLGVSTLDILGVALAEHFGEASIPGMDRTRHFLRATSYIQAHADDATLNPSGIAAAIGVSVRYLHILFREHDTTVSAYVFRERLARCYEALVNPLKAGMSVTEIAHSHGFKTAAHFSRRFSSEYGRTPLEVRRSGAS